MKHYLKMAVVASLFISVCYWNSIKTPENVKALVLQNVEALADGEYPSGQTGCFGTGSLDCPSYHYKVKYVIRGYSLEE